MRTLDTRNATKDGEKPNNENAEAVQKKHAQATMKTTTKETESLVGVAIVGLRTRHRGSSHRDMSSHRPLAVRRSRE